MSGHRTSKEHGQCITAPAVTRTPGPRHPLRARARDGADHRPPPPLRISLGKYGPPCAFP
ncbi:hypothetical protein CWN80_04975 [Janibacter hoylei PVAS-1]|uniref:Uncharacterized protein n=1 Tax=Janibacter hoylei PVAS-1 TaxID=1210046 RepID=A0A444B7V3_9MICO|nr:hypothetical protein CWN80_04975 [Janibacter hoylei PVAS-1]